ncbi:hypothetical protein GCM10027034_15010 [Ramlibacter solisilvae]|uniref:Uncharacterized protein n=1 Tax=Ramlibacter tataouinensis TaxID=94132 RepID=A0A127JW97_9BURK|nr:hypothetical protein [Ramlibacter tataouinensis]AMO24288.1 hypothetical protein UC35_17370 [Ramlibacter tataouinensis]
METSFLASLALCACALFGAVSAFANMDAARQRSYRLLRVAHIPATLAVLALEIVLIADGTQGFWAAIAAVSAVLMGLGTQLRALERGKLPTVWFAGVAPWLLILSTVANVKGVPGGAQLPLLALVPAVLAAVCMWWADFELEGQGFAALRD